jgi:hypothetical protein
VLFDQNRCLKTLKLLRRGSLRGVVLDCEGGVRKCNRDKRKTSKDRPGSSQVKGSQEDRNWKKHNEVQTPRTRGRETARLAGVGEEQPLFSTLGGTAKVAVGQKRTEAVPLSRTVLPAERPCRCGTGSEAGPGKK